MFHREACKEKHSYFILNRQEDKIKSKYKVLPNLVNNTNSSIRLLFKIKK